MKKRKITVAIILSAVMLIGSTLCVYAATNGFNSKGRIVFSGNDGQENTADDITFDASDLNTIYDSVAAPRTTLASVINAQGNAYIIPSNQLTLDPEILRFSTINTQLKRQFELPGVSTPMYFDLTNGLTFSSNANSESVTCLPIKGTESLNIDGVNYLLVDEMSAGVTAWDEDGNINIGTGVEENKYYNNGYLKGVADEKARITGATIKYNFHTHTNTNGGNTVTTCDTVDYTGENKSEISSTSGGCYNTPVYHHHSGNSTYGGGCYVASYTLCDGHGEYDGTSSDEVVCDKCGRTMYDGPYYLEYLGNKCNASVFKGYVLGCGHSENDITGYAADCGHKNGEVLEAIISY